MNANDKYRFRMFLDALVFHWQHAVDADESLPKENIKRVLSQPGGVWYWARAKDVLTPEFIAFVESQLDE